MAALLTLPTAPPLRTRQAAAGGAACALRCSAVACMRAQALATPRSARFKPATAAGRRMRFLVSASDVRSRFATGGASHSTKHQRSRNTCTALQRQVEDWEPLETPRSPPTRLPQPLPPLPPPPPLARSGMSDTVKAAGACCGCSPRTPSLVCADRAPVGRSRRGCRASALRSARVYVRQHEAVVAGDARP